MSTKQKRRKPVKEPQNVGHYETHRHWGQKTRTKFDSLVWAYKRQQGVRLFAALYGPNGYTGSYFYLNISALRLRTLLRLAEGVLR